MLGRIDTDGKFLPTTIAPVGHVDVFRTRKRFLDDGECFELYESRGGHIVINREQIFALAKLAAAVVA